MSAVLQDQHTTTKDWLNDLFQVYEDGLNGHRDHPLAQFRRQAFRELQELDFPTRRDEDWKYTSVAPMLKQPYQEGRPVAIDAKDLEGVVYPELNALQLVFTNGVLDPRHSDLDELPEGLHILPVSQAMEADDTRRWIEAQVEQEGGTGKNTFLPLNRAFAGQGLLLRAERHAAIERPVHLIYLSAPGADPHFAHPQLFVQAKTGSRLTLIESYRALEPDSSYFTNAAAWIEVAANARVDHYRLQRESRAAYQINNILVRQDRDSTYSSYVADLGGKLVRNNLSTTLLNSNTQTNYYGIYLANGKQHIDNQTFIDHAVPHCQSNELYKGILTDGARGVFNGKVMVRQDAQKTNAFQQNSSLVLSPRAVMDTKPQLEIYADDVRCSHGATIGQLDEAAVFYLRSRGIPGRQARNLLQQAFLREVVHFMALEPVAARVRALIEEKLREA